MSVRKPDFFSHEAILAAKNYEIGMLIDETEEIGGTTSNAKRLDTDRGSYVLRRLSGVGQAEREHRISAALLEQKICPEVLQTRRGGKWFEESGRVYNLQQFITPIDGDDVHLDYAQLGCAVGKLHTALRNQVLEEQPDRFELQTKWHHFLKSHPEGDFNEPLVQRLGKYVEICLRQEERSIDKFYIHGDLGRWNLIFGREGARIIDFGEVRRGNPHFDLAALMSSTLDVSNEQAFGHLSAFTEAYSLQIDGFRSEELAVQIRLWNIRGAVALLDTAGVNERSLRYVEEMLKQCEVWMQMLR